MNKELITKIDLWLDQNVSNDYLEQPLAQDWARVSKVIEELGEAIQALVISTGQNPRKPRSLTRDDMLDELCDVVITATLAIQHYTKDADMTIARISDKLWKIVRRNPEILKP